MNYQEALKIVDEAIAAKEGRRLNNVEIAIFQGAWQGLTYDAIATKSGYEINYLKGDAGHKFWKLLSEALGDRITKTNFKAVLESRQPPSHASVSSSSDLYIERPPIESKCKEKILTPGALLRIKGSHKMGKTALLSKLINFADSQDYNAVHLPFGLAEKEDYETLDGFLKWFCMSLTQMLPSEYLTKKDWLDNQPRWSKMKAFNYIEDHLLKGDDKPPLVLGLDDLDLVYPHQQIVDGFLTWLRALHEKANTRAIWGKFRLILTYREPYIHLPDFSSPFNVGEGFELLELNEKQVQELVNKNGLTDRLSQQEIKDLMVQVGGNPFLVQRALNEIITQQLSLKEILNKATTESGIYSQELQKQLFYLRKKPALQEIFKTIIKSDSPIENLDLAEKNQLEGLGLVKPENNGFVPFCQLYRNYFIKVL